MTLAMPQYALSYWELETFFKGIDLAIIGGGIVGLSAALRAREISPAARIVVLERGPLPIGASTRNAGFACFGSASELLDDLGSRPEEEVWNLVADRWEGLRRLRQRIGDRALQYEQVGGFELFRSADHRLYEACMDNLSRFNQELYRITGNKEVFLRTGQEVGGTFGFAGVKQLIFNQAEGLLNPGKLMAQLIALAQQAGVLFFPGIEVTELTDTGSGVALQTRSGFYIQAGKVLLAANAFAGQLVPEADLKPARNQVLVTAPVPGLSWKGGFHYDRGYTYFRHINGRVLLGGGRNLDPEGETTTAFGTTPLIQGYLLHLLREVILPGQEVAVDHWWSGILGVGSHKSPIIRPVSDHVALAVRLGGMGVAIGTLVGETGAALIMGRQQ